MSMESSVTTLRNAQRAHVINMASDLFAERGIRGVRMDDVAAMLSMSKRTLYEMFHDKEELLLECVKCREERKVEYLREISAKADNVLEVVLHFYLHGLKEMGHTNDAVIEEIKKYPTVCEYMALRRKENILKAKAFYVNGVEQGMFRTDINFEIFHMLMGLAMDGYFNGERLKEFPLMEVFDTIIRVNMRGICTEKGIRLFDEFLAKNHLQ